MFDIAFSEMLVIGVVALVVIGPERLPRVARTMGHLIGRLQRYVHDVKSDIDREMRLEDLKKLQQDVTSTASDIESSIRQSLSSAEHDLAKSLKDAEAVAADLADAATLTPPPLVATTVVPLGNTQPPEGKA